MLKAIVAGTAALAIAGGSLALAQTGPRTDTPRWQPSAEDFAAMADARVAALKAGLRLTPAQEQHWPAVETAIRDLAKERAALMTDRRAARAADAPRPDLLERMRRGADAMTTRADSLKKLADAAEPLYKSLDEDQQRRFAMLLRAGGAGMGPRHARGQRFGGRPRSGDRGPRGRGGEAR